MTTLVLRRASVSRKSGQWQDEDYDVVDGDRDVGRIYQVNAYPGQESWFWGLGFEAQLDGKKRYGHVESRAGAMAAFKAEYERWLQERG